MLTNVDIQKILPHKYPMLLVDKVIELGSDYIVVGRPVTAAEDPVAAYLRCVEEFVG